MSVFRRINREKAGFTVIEALVVIAIMVIVSSFVAYPEIRRIKRVYDNRSTAQAVASAFYFARTASYTYPNGVIVTYDSDSRTLRVCADQNSSNSCDSDTPGGDLFLQTMTLEKAENVDFDFTEGNFVIFRRGFPKTTSNAFAAGTVTVDDFRISVSRTGRVRVEKVS
ncbi:pilus assembly FimT family protein [Thermodesulforhabdus norvegica]|uniref:Prepilin-type N-terminal cleavage/methylation domain-containing protein n=1 Tax=Thermodesulforhabdus norvegica TaxID=39841 RepID=A0A1I4U0H1_9BACT|nr:prepilin-type N-terminal cleavage/methylation domain-containing protein [Thermodesulforhabdus norvegica]SFM82233.1 prepilin-type N-terminal cleavage/methylation domain-containing protein [Thermodesulforhabdus norvegica]